MKDIIMAIALAISLTVYAYTICVMLGKLENSYSRQKANVLGVLNILSVMMIIYSFIKYIVN
jgi:hypothetical protein